MSQAIAVKQSTTESSFLTMFLISFTAHILTIILFVLLPGILPHRPHEAFGGPSGGGVMLVRLGSAKTSLKPAVEQEAAPSKTIEKLKKDEEVELKSQTTLPDLSTKKKEEPKPKATLNQPEKKLTGPFSTGKNTKAESTNAVSSKIGVGPNSTGQGDPGAGTGTGIAFPFPWYIDAVVDKIQGNWVKPFMSVTPAQTPEAVIYFVITKVGQVKDIRVEKSSGIAALDRAAESAIQNSQPFPPLPAQWTEPDLAFQLTFQYSE